MAQLAKQMIAVIHERKRDEIAALEKTRLQALGSRGRKKERCGRGSHARREGVLAWKALENRFNSHSVRADISNRLRGSRGKKYSRGARKLSISKTKLNAGLEFWQRADLL